MAYPSTLPPTAKLPDLEAGDQLVAVVQATGILAGRFAIARPGLPAQPPPHRLLALVATWNCGSWHGTTFPFARTALMVDDIEERQGRVVGHFQIDVRQLFELPPHPGTLHVSARILHLWTPPVVVATP